MDLARLELSRLKSSFVVNPKQSSYFKIKNAKTKIERPSGPFFNQSESHYNASFFTRKVTFNFKLNTLVSVFMNMIGGNFQLRKRYLRFTRKSRFKFCWKLEHPVSIDSCHLLTQRDRFHSSQGFLYDCFFIVHFIPIFADVSIA